MIKLLELTSECGKDAGNKDNMKNHQQKQKADL